MTSIRMGVLGVLVLLLLGASAATAGHGKFDSSLRLLRDLRSAGASAERLDPGAQRAVEADEVLVSVQFDHVLSAGEIAAFEGDGISFFRIDGVVARTRAIYPVRVPWSRLDAMGLRSEVTRVESAWKPCVFPPLDLGNPEVQADSVWLYQDPLGVPLTGKGMRVADFDTGTDIFHPSLFFADGDTLDWIDVDTSGDFTPGTDAVDINDNGTPDAGEILRFNDGWISDYAGVFSGDSPSNDDGIYQTYWDWLYADTNDDGDRDFGPAAGFVESDPTYGEPLFIALDDNDNGALDTGERLVALGTSKVVVTLNSGLVTRTRGVDLILSDIDTYGHGTPVSGAIAGGWPGRHRFTGIAPDAELIIGNYMSQIPISYLIPWARSHGADVMLHEWSGFTFVYLDGSSLDEQLVSAEHADIVQVVPSGNLTGGGKHSISNLVGPSSKMTQIVVPTYYGNIEEFYYTARWRPDEYTDLTFQLMLPSGQTITLTDSVSTAGNYYIWHNKDVSPRGTHKLDLLVERGSNASVNGTWRVTITNDSTYTVAVICDVADNVSSWSGGTVFTLNLYNNRNVTLPATSDSALVNGSYSTRGFESYYGVGGGSISPGELSSFSGRGQRIDGLPLVDICSPGNYDVFSPRSHQDVLGYPLGSYQQFSGTSAAGPFVAAAAALVLQAHPEIRPAQVEQMLAAGALVDGFTGTVRNPKWGWGKLRILSALDIASGVQDMADGKRTPELYLDQNYPNPFNPSTWIPFFIPTDGAATLTVYNVRGEVVKVLRNKWYQRGPHSVRWDGRDGGGRSVASGVYFCVLQQAGVKQTRKMVLIR